MEFNYLPQPSTQAKWTSTTDQYHLWRLSNKFFFQGTPIYRIDGNVNNVNLKHLYMNSRSHFTLIRAKYSVRTYIQCGKICTKICLRKKIMLQNGVLHRRHFGFVQPSMTELLLIFINLSCDLQRSLSNWFIFRCKLLPCNMASQFQFCGIHPWSVMWSEHPWNIWNNKMNGYSQNSLAAFFRSNHYTDSDTYEKNKMEGRMAEFRS